ncbi:prepilin peptidase [Candidatus Peregrinibacteria bacterium]|nr:prepilin peptidase [Candidatus Peregrinibacteria bacterium]
MTIFSSALIFITGTIIGSFLSVIIYRIKTKQKGIIFSRSMCPHCKKKLKFRYLVPILSWVFLGGKCGYCSKKISTHYIALEIICGTLFLAIFLNYNFLEQVQNIVDFSLSSSSINYQTFEIFLFYIVEFSFLMGIFFYDLLHKEIPDSLSLPAIVIAIAGGLLLNTVSPLNMLIGGIILFGFFALQFLLSRGTWIGGGDLRLGALIGVLLGWQYGIIALVSAYILGALMSIVLIVRGKITRKSTVAFGPYLVTGTLIAFLFGERILSFYLDTMII